MSVRSTLLVGGLTALLLAGAAAPGGLFVPAPARADDMVMSMSNAELVRRLIPMVVNITAHAEIPDDATPVEASAGQKSSETAAAYQVRTSAGSGFVIDTSGVIVTNWHVVSGAYEVIVTFSDGSRAKAEISAAARPIDIALLKVDVGHDLPAATWGDSRTVQVGDPVLAIGNPLGIGMSVSGGIVSALNRNIMDTPYDDFIQTDAAINHGNSGGPLFNLKGEVIGVNSALISPTSGNAGLGFALPANDARIVVRRLIDKEYGRPAWLGVKIQQLTPEMGLALGNANLQGSIVAWVLPGGPAEKAGVRIGDVIEKLSGEAPSDDRALLRMIAENRPGTDVDLTILRDGKDITLPAKLGEWPQMQWERAWDVGKLSAPHLNIPRDLGVTVVSLTPQMRAEKEIPPDATGALVTAVVQNTDAARRGISPGDVVIEVNGSLIPDQAHLQQMIDAVRTAKRPFAMFLILPKKPPTSAAQAPGPKWVPLRVSAEDIRN